jgi:V8-like Glu-specific endopeptidase
MAEKKLQAAGRSKKKLPGSSSERKQDAAPTELTAVRLADSEQLAAETFPRLGEKGHLLPEFRAATESAAETLLRERTPSAEPAERQAENVVLVDDRVRLNPLRFPYNCVCHLRMTFRGLGAFVGTGFFVGRRTILTAGHNVYDREAKAALQIEVRLGQDGSPLHPTPILATPRNLATTKEYMESGDCAADFGAILFDRDVADEWMGFDAANDDDLRGLTVHVVGYPGKSEPPPGWQANTMWGHARQLLDPSATQLFYDIDTSRGQSGSPVFYVGSAGDVFAVGIHNQGFDRQSRNRATRINEAVFNLIKGWKSEVE